MIFSSTGNVDNETDSIGNSFRLFSKLNQDAIVFCFDKFLFPKILKLKTKIFCYIFQVLMFKLS